MSRVAAALLLAAGAAASLACGASLRRLDEAEMLAGPHLELKLVRYYESLPLHFDGEIAVVQCRSASTRDVPAGRTNDAGWVELGRFAAIGSRSAAELVEHARRDYAILDDGILVWKGIVLQSSFDGCASFARWDPTTLPAATIEPAPKPDYCAPKGSADCRYWDFEGDRRPDYSEISAARDGKISFLVRSAALRGSGALRVRSADFGASWQVETAGAAP